MSSAEEKQWPQLRAVAAEQELRVGPFIPAHELLALRPPAPLVSGVFALGHVGAIVGEYGSGKTFAGLDLAGAVGMGRPWLGAQTHVGAVALVEADSPGNSLVPRLLALEARYPGTISSQRLHFLAEGLTLVDAVIDLLARIHELEKRSRETIRLVIIDSTTATLSEAGGANGGMEAARGWVKAARILTEKDRRAVVGLAHVGKDVSRGILGSVALPAGLDVVLSMKPEGDGGMVISSAKGDGGKSRDWAACRASFRLAPERDSAVIEMVQPFSLISEETPRRKRAPGTAGGLLLGVAKTMAPRVRGRRAEHSDWPLIGLEELRSSWAEALRAARPGARTTPHIFNRTLDDLVAGCWLGREDGGIYVV